MTLPKLPRVALAWLLLASAIAPSQAQVAVALPGLPSLEQPLAPVLADVERRFSDIRRLRIQTLLRRHREELDTDAAGGLLVRGEILLLAPTDATLQLAHDAGYAARRTLTLAPLDMQVVVLQAPPGMTTRRALRRLQRLVPDAEFAFNHIYLDSAAQAAPAPASGPSAPGGPGLAVGLIDSGVDRRHPALADVRIVQWGCAGKPISAAHGTAVASLLVGSAAGAVGSDSQLFAADIYCGQATGGAVANLAQAMAWMASHEVKVINLSLVGADNPLLKKVIAAMLARGHLLVAAVGNDGPASPPLYPAAYPGVIGVTAVDRRHRLLPEALRGDQVTFAAPGANLRAAAQAADWQSVRGTSFAAPLVARLAATLWRPGERAEQVLARLQAQALDLGGRGRDNRYGHGLLGQELDLQYIGKK